MLADAVGNHVDAVIGDHTNFQVLATRSNGVLTTENLSKGVRFTRVRLVIGPGKEGVVYKTADFHKPWTIGVTPDAAIQEKIDALNRDLAPILGVVSGQSTKEILRADQCGRIDGRLCESFVGNTVTDALRTNNGTQFAITNSGGLRAALTCPAAGGPGAGFCPAGSTGPPFQITLGAIYGVLPFGNFSVTLDVTGPELKSMLERGVSAMPAADGRFPQVSGLCFTYDVAAPVGSRVTGAVVANADGSCTTTAVNLTSGTYHIATNDFTASGGDGYPNFRDRFHSEGVLLATDLADYVEAHSPVAPVVRAAPNGRINCADSNGVTAPNCPTLTPSP